MSEYWKSTPKYWCKFCKTYVKDTKLEKQQHEATPRHQGNIQRSLRTLHREHEREDREKQRAKDEVERLNGLVSGDPVVKKSSWTNRNAAPAPAGNQQLTAEERKRQMKQLADMGIAIPKQYRGDMAIAGDWETVAVRQVKEHIKAESLSHGVRKRKLEDEEDIDADDENLDQSSKRKGWGSTFREYPGQDQSSEDIESLLKSGQNDQQILQKAENEETIIKKEESGENTESKSAIPTAEASAGEAIAKEQDPEVVPPVVFKKRKAKSIKP